MQIHNHRPANGCLAPVVIDHVVDDPDQIRELARLGGPYSQPGRQRTPPGLVWPAWRTEWARGGEVLVAGAEDLLHHSGFIAAATDMFAGGHVEPRGIYVNLSTPSHAQPVGHTDLPEFRGLGKDDAPGWFLQAMGTSRLFERERRNTVTAVSWFHRGQEGHFRYWPDGWDAPSVLHTDMWNTAVVGDNDFMHHKVEQVGVGSPRWPSGLTIDATLDVESNGDGVNRDWVVVDEEDVLATYRDDEVRMSVSWTAKVIDEAAEAVTLDAVFDRMRDALDGALVAASPESLFDAESQHQLIQVWPGFRRG